MFLGAFLALGVTFTGVDRAMSGYWVSEETNPETNLTMNSGTNFAEAALPEANLAERPNSDK
jgi:hypothetical protein